jgi:protein phosphatase methylesterase 1
MFPSTADAIEWSVRSGDVRNRESAVVSVPPRLRSQKDKNGQTVYVWRTNLLETEKHWRGLYFLYHSMWCLTFLMLSHCIAYVMI